MLEQLKEHIDSLIALYEGEKQRADSLESRLRESEEAVASYREQITQLNHQIDNLRLTGALVSGADTSESKARLARLIAEIDKCIKLLEK